MYFVPDWYLTHSVLGGRHVQRVHGERISIRIVGAGIQVGSCADREQVVTPMAASAIIAPSDYGRPSNSRDCLSSPHAKHTPTRKPRKHDTGAIRAASRISQQSWYRAQKQLTSSCPHPCRERLLSTCSGSYFPAIRPLAVFNLSRSCLVALGLGPSYFFVVLCTGARY